MVRAWHVLGTVLVILLAGCGGTGQTGGQSPDPVSPAPVPTDEPIPTPRPRVAPGVTAAGIVDPLTLSEAHDRYLRNRSETVRLTRTNRYPNGTLRDRTVQVTKVAANRHRFHTIISVRGPHARFFGPGGRGEFWSDGERMLQRLVGQNTTSHSVTEPVDYEPQLSRPLVPSPGGGQVFFLATLGTFRVTDRSELNGTPVVRLEMKRITQPNALAASESVSDPRNVSLTMLVDERGVLRRFVLTYTAEQGETTVHVRLTGEHRAIGSTTVDRPAWFDRAMNGSG